MNLHTLVYGRVHTRLCHLLYFVALLVAIIHVTASAAPAPNGIVAWWPLQGNGNDVSGRNHPLTIQGSPIFGDGEVGQAVVLDGGNDYGRVGPHPDLDLGANDALTIELWINPANTAPQQPLLEWTDNISVVGLHFWMSVVSPGVGGGPRSLFANVIDRNGVAHHVSSAPGVIASNAFTHVAFTYSKISGLAKLYANGQPVATTNIGSVTPETRTALYAGWRPLGGGQYRFAGKLDEITLYSRELSQAELNSIFQAGVTGKGSITNPPPPAALVYDVSEDFLPGSNPSGSWSYGWKDTLAGAFTALTFGKNFASDNGVPIFAWQLSASEGPTIARVIGPGTAVSAAGQFVAPPGTVYFTAGSGSPQNLGAVRFTVPPGQAGTYTVKTFVRDVFDGSFQGDTDFHVTRNGVELFSQFLPPHTTAGYTNVLTLAEGDTVDFLVGRGADGSLAGSLLKLTATLTISSNVPPAPVVSDLSQDFSVSNNPAGVWSYGWKSNFTSPLGLLADVRTFGADNGVPIHAWELTTYNLPVVAKVLGPNTAVSDGGRFTAPGGTVYFAPGADGTAQNYGVIRYTAPTGGNYRVEVSVNPLFDSTRSRDSDFHILRNGVELFGAFLQPNTGTNYAAVVALTAGQALDFAVGRGADGLTADTGLKIAAVITPTTNAPTTTNPPPVVVENFDVSRDFAMSSNPTGVWSYGWKSSFTGPLGLLADVRTFSSDNGVPIRAWELTTLNLPVVAKVLGTNTAISDGGRFTASGGTVYLAPGADGTPQNYGVIRFTAPTGGNYRVELSVNPLFDSTRSRDSDFHVLRNGDELFGAFLAPNTGTNYAAVVSLTAGQTLDFAVGRGADGLTADTGLKIGASIALTTNAPSGTNPPAVTPALISLWHADGDAEDAVGTNDGVLVNNVGFEPGVIGQAFRLDGTNFVRVVDNASLDLANELTMQMWFKRDGNLPLNETFALMDKRTAVLANYGANMSQNYGLQLYYNTGSGFALSSSPLPSGGVWHHFAGTYRQRSNGVELITYIDGSAVRTNTLPGTLSAAVNDAPLVIGTARNGAAEYFKGLIDEVALYNYALNSAQVLSNYNSVTPPGTNPPPAVAGDFNAVRDFSLNSNPNGAWSYGWQSNTAGSFTPVTHTRTTTAGAGATMQIWEFNTGTAPYFLHFPLSNTGTGTSEGGYGQYPPGTLIAQAGAGAPHNLATIRFTAPSNGNYTVGVAVRSYLDGGPAGDTDFHVTRNGTELFGQFLPAVGSTAYTNTLSLLAGDTIDFATGRGADNNYYGSGLKIAAVITPTTNAPSGTNAPSPFSITFPKVAPDGFEFMLPPGVGSHYVIEVSEDLARWSVLTNVVSSNSLMRFRDPDSLTLSRRFYRARPVAP